MEIEKELNDYIRYLENNIRSDEQDIVVINKCNSKFSHIKNMFREICGITPREYLQKRRMYESALELLNGKSVSYVSDHYGYNSVSTFSKAFLKFHGVNPSKINSYNLQKFTAISIRVEISYKE